MADATKPSTAAPEILLQMTKDHLESGLRGVPVGYCTTSAVEADTKADMLRIERRNTGSEGAAIPTKLRADAVEAERRLAVVGATLMDAVDYYLAHARPAGGTRTVHQVVAEFMAAKRTAGRA